MILIGIRKWPGNRLAMIAKLCADSVVIDKFSCRFSSEINNSRLRVGGRKLIPTVCFSLFFNWFSFDSLLRRPMSMVAGWNSLFAVILTFRFFICRHSTTRLEVPRVWWVSKPSKARRSCFDIENFFRQTNHPKAKEWMLAAARANYQELAKLASEHPQLVKLQVSRSAFDN